MKIIKVAVLGFILIIIASCTSIDSISLDSFSLDKISLPKISSFKFGVDNQWPSYGRNLTNQRFSPLTQVNQDNVKNLELAWKFKTGVLASFQASPLVINNVMFVSLPHNHVVAIDAKTGKELWRYTHEKREGWRMCCGPANRGLAYASNKIFIGTVDARLIALDAKTGKKVWDIDVADNNNKFEDNNSLSQSDSKSQKEIYGQTGVGISMAPVTYDKYVIIGITGVGYGLHTDTPRPDAPLGAVIGVDGRYGRPGFLAAYNINTGKRVWQFDTIPAVGWEGKFKETIEGNISLNRNIAQEKENIKNNKDAWKFGGGSAWSTPAIDENTNTLYFGTGNPSPQMNDTSRPGDNLYTVSLVALDASSGKLKWFYQQVPHDVWGYDVASPPVLFDYKKNGEKIPAVGQASKTGWYYIHNRITGELLAKSESFVPQKNMFAKATPEGTILYPGILGGANWGPMSLDEKNQIAFISAIHAPIKYTLVDEPAHDDLPAIKYVSSEPTKDERWGLLSAIDLNSKKIKWQVKTEQPLTGGLLATEGNLVFMGEGNGNFNAYDAQTGKLLWKNKADAGVNAPPITYEIDGTQYIAVAAGGNSIFGFKEGDNILVYKLK